MHFEIIEFRIKSRDREDDKFVHYLAVEKKTIKGKILAEIKLALAKEIYGKYYEFRIRKENNIENE